MNFLKNLKTYAIKEIFSTEDLQLNSPSLRHSFQETRLRNIRHNWRILMYMFKMLDLIAIPLLFLENASYAFKISRAIILLILLCIFIALDHYIPVSERIAEKSGHILIVILVIGFTEINLGLKHYR